MDNLMYLIVMWIAAILFIIIGIYAMNRKKPMWLWSGSPISESDINDVKAYNRAMGRCGVYFLYLCLWVELWNLFYQFLRF